MNEDFKYLLSEIAATESDKWGAMIRLINDEHTDYIEDVLAEHFDMDYEFKVVNEDTKDFIIYFNDKAKLKDVKKAVNTINAFHKQNSELYETI